MDIVIRRYNKEDQEKVFQLHKISLKAASSYYKSGGWEDDLKDIENIYLNGKGEFLVLLFNNDIIAIGALRQIDEKSVELKRLRVHPDYQRKGLGQKMLDVLEGKARELVYETIQLNTTIQQIAAQNLYKKNGYTEFKRIIKPYFKEFSIELIYYKKKL